MSTTYVNDFSRRFSIGAAHTALVVVDMQNATGNRSMGLGKKLAAEGRLESASYRFDRIENTIVPNTQKLLAAFRGAGAPVIYITYGAERPDAMDVPEHIRGIVLSTNNIDGHPEHEIVDALTPQAGETVLNKVTMGAFQSTGIESRLRALSADSIVVVGVSTNNCVAMTAMEASDRGFGVVLVSDATGTDSEDMQIAYEELFTRLWGRVETTQAVIEELTSGAAAKAAE